MTSKTGVILIILAWLTYPGLVDAQDPANCLAVITELKGEVMIRKVSDAEFVRAFWGTQVFKGDQLKTSANSDVVLTLSNKGIIRLGPGSTLTVSDNNPSVTAMTGNVKTISSSMMVNLSALIAKREDRKDVSALAGLRLGEVSNIIELVSPNNSFIKTSRPSFSWLPKKSFDNYIVNLYSSKGLVWSKKISENLMKYPDNEKDLEFGESYFWNVEGEDLLDNKKSANNKFSILSLEKSREVEQQETVIRNTFKDEPEGSSLHSVLGAYYINQGLLQDAIEEFQIISIINTDAPLPHEILGSLYSDAGNKDKAIEELQKALALAKNNKE
jgi:hypothetical protein